MNDDLNDKQRDILTALAGGGSMTTAQLVAVFREDRERTWIDYSWAGLHTCLVALERRDLVERRRIDDGTRAVWAWSLAAERVA